ncbi:hypothetical protein Dda_3554 [Drechslerella dactyloides]|uniref:Uncharacterized protein n=1 Tax=Drechslerella dactyloides TaxID=74499 RepID=A0AAD6IY79_DREDA|nr:hypothetical protein Dda_3554 [Drechslerella dactyloides]
MQHSGDSDDSRASGSRARDHLAGYPVFRLVNDYTPFHLPALLIKHAPALPDPLDAAVDDGLSAVDSFMESRVASMKRGYERWVLRPQENIRTGVGVYTDWGKGQVSGSIRRLEECIVTVGEYLLPTEEEDNDGDHAGMNSYWTSTESVIDSDDDEYDEKKNETAKLQLQPLTSATAAAEAENHHHQHRHHHQRPRSASAPSLPPFQANRPGMELGNIGKLLVIYARRTYVKNAHKSPTQMLHDALDLAKTEAGKAARGIDEKYSIEIGYLRKMMEAGRQP